MVAWNKSLLEDIEVECEIDLVCGLVQCILAAQISRPSDVSSIISYNASDPTLACKYLMLEDVMPLPVTEPLGQRAPRPQYLHAVW